MSYYGSWKIDDLLTFCCNTHSPATGAATDADSVPSYRVYEDETGTAILTGSMAKLDDTNTTGFYSEQITLSAANGFEKGKCYTVYISATVGSVVGTMHHNFQIEAEVDANSANGLAVQADVENYLDYVEENIRTQMTGLVFYNGDVGSTGNDTTHVHLPGLTYGDDEINNLLLVIYDSSANELHSRWITDWTDSSNLATVATLPFTPEATNDKYWLLSIRQDVTGGSGLDAAGVRAAIGMASANLDTQLLPLADLSFTASGVDANIVAINGENSAASHAESFFDTGGGVISTLSKIADAVWDEATSGHTTNGTFGQRLFSARSGTAQAGDADTITLDASAHGTYDIYSGMLIVITAGTGARQARFVTDYDGSTKVATVSPAWLTHPSSDSEFVIVPFGSIPGATAPTAAEVADAVWDEARSEHEESGTFGQQVNANITAVAGTAGAATALESFLDTGGGVTNAINKIRDAIKAMVVESRGSITFGQAQSIMLAILAGVTDDGGITFKTHDGNTIRAEVTIDEENSERTAVTLTPSS